MNIESINIMVIEDNPTDILLIRRRLKKIFPHSKDPVFCVSLHEGVERLHQEPVDILLLDLSLPDSHGMETLQKVRSQAVNLAIVVMTGLNDESMALTALQEGAQDYLVKGEFDEHQLYRTILHAIERHRLTIQVDRQTEELRIRETNLRNVIFCNFDGIVILDLSGIVRFANPAAEALLGQTSEQLVGHPFPAEVPSGTVSELKIARRQGDHIIVDMRIADIQWEGTAGVVVSLRDLTARVTMENALKSERRMLAQRVEERTAELSAVNTELTKAMRRKDEFLATMSHELRTPMNAIIGYSEILADNIPGELNAKQSRYVNHILGSGRHLLNLINDILDLSKIEAGQMQISRSNFSIADLLQEVTAFIRPMAEQKRIVAELNMRGDLGTIYADPQRLQQVLYNLLSNAVKFTPDGGSIHISARRAEVELSKVSSAVGNGGEIRIPDGQLATATINPDKQNPDPDDPSHGLTAQVMPAQMVNYPVSHVIISVTDSGIGIKHEDIDRVFAKFEQIDSTYARQQQGTGLGLTISKSFVELHGGKISVTSEGEGKGSTFTVELPIVLPASITPLESDQSGESDVSFPELPHAGTGDKTIIVIEDDRRMWELIAGTLVRQGYKVVFAADGEAGLRKVRECQPVAVLLDMFLPIKDGWQVLSELKSSPDTQDIPVIVISMANEDKMGYSAGVVDWIVKPIDRSHLLNTLRKCEKVARKTVMNILIIDDEPNSIEIIAEQLINNGYRVLKARNGEEGLEIAEQSLPDMIILDLMMPGMTGFEVVDRLKANIATSAIPIVINSAKELTNDERKSMNGKTHDIFSKSNNMDLLDFLRIQLGSE